MRRYSTYLFDLDGVVYRGPEPIPGAIETLNALRDADIVFVTNNSSLTRTDYAQKLRGMGFECEPSQFYTSASATATWIANEMPNATAYVVGSLGLIAELEQAGIRIGEDGDFVVVGIDRDFTYEKLDAAQRAIRKGARFIATNLDSTYPADGGRTQPGAGSLVAAVAAASGQSPIGMGKPEARIVQSLIDRADWNPHDCLVVGDRVDTDIELAYRLGCDSALVLTGVSDGQDLDLHPTYVIDRLEKLLQLD